MMNAPTGNLAKIATASELDQVHIWRSKFIDYASRCETRLRVMHKTHSLNSEVFLQIKSLAVAVKASHPGCSKLAAAIDDLIPLIELRAALAHSVVTMLNNNSQQTAVFLNADNRALFGRHALILDLKERERALHQIKTAADRLKRLQKVHESNSIATPPPSPPQPKQGAATGP